MPEKISDDELLEDLNRVADQVGESPTVMQYREHGEYSPHTFQLRFGSWTEAKKQAGIPVNHSPTEQDLLDDIQRVADEIGESPTMRDYREHGDYSVTKIHNTFDTWNKAKKRLGLQVNNRNKPRVSLDEIISDLENGLSKKEVREKHGYSSKGIIREKLKRAGYKVRSRLSKNEAAYSGNRFSGILSIPASTLDELSIESVEQGYYDIEPFQEDGEKGVKIIFNDSRVKEVEEDNGGENTE